MLLHRTSWRRANSTSRNRPPGYTQADFDKILCLQQELAELLALHLGEYHKSGFVVLKMHAIVAQARRSILWRCGTTWGNTNIGEQCHKTSSHRPYQATNGQLDTASAQTARAYVRREVLSQLAIDNGVSSGMAQHASEEDGWKRMTCFRATLRTGMNKLASATKCLRLRMLRPEHSSELKQPHNSYEAKIVAAYRGLEQSKIRLKYDGP